MRTLFLSSCVRGGGAGWSLYYLLKHLDRASIEPIIAVPGRGIFDRRFDDLRLRVIVPPRLHDRTVQLRFRTNNRLTAAVSVAWNLWDSVVLIPNLARLLRREGVELVYCNNMMVKPIGALAAQLAGVPCVLHVRNLHEQPATLLFYGLIARLPAVKRLIANSAASAVPYRRHVPRKIDVVHNGVDLAEFNAAAVPRGRFRRELGIAKDTVLVGFTGNLIPRKGLDPLIRAAARLLPVRPCLEFVAVGRVPVGNPVNHRAEYEALAHELGIADRFHFCGFRDDVRSAVADFDVLVLPSFQEPFGRSIIEAMALGTAVVATRVGGLPEVLRHEREGLLVEAGDVEGLAGAIGRLVDDPGYREELSRRALDRVLECFDVSVLARQMQKLLLDAAR
jgi:glycosyltransferase involved in cell wall biosynthesis